MAREQRSGPQSTAFERPSSSSKTIFKRLWIYLTKDKWLLGAAILLSIGSNLLVLWGPKLSGHAIDAIKPGPGKVDFPTVFYYAGLMILFYVLSSALSYLLAALMVQVSRNVVFHMRQEVYEHLMRLPVRFFDHHATGDVLSVLSYDIDTINSSLSNDLVQILANVITVCGSFYMMLTISPVLVLVFAVTVPVSFLFTRYRSRHARILYRERSKTLGNLNGYAEEITGGLRTITAYHRQQFFCDGFQQKNVDACEANRAADAYSSTTGPLVNFVNNLSLALVSMFGALLYMSGNISLGNVSTFVLYSRKFSGPINEFSNIISELQSALAAAERVFRLLDEPAETPDAPDAIPLSQVRGEIKLEDVSFGYTPDTFVLKNYTLRAQPGQTIAIVGPTGAGKTTVINLLMRFYDVNSGSIYLDGHSLYSLRRSDIRRAFSMVLQDTWLFSGTIFENLAYGKEDVTEEEVIQAAKAAKIHYFIEALPQGYHTVLSDGGGSISKGQKQLLTIARAMLLDAPMLILDEATSNVDTQTERRIQKAMLNLMKGRTCFVIAHRLSTIRNADSIAVLQNGQIVEQGTHADLMSQNGYYAELYRAQFESTPAEE